jgi:competence protein ComEA
MPELSKEQVIITVVCLIFLLFGGQIAQILGRINVTQPSPNASTIHNQPSIGTFEAIEHAQTANIYIQIDGEVLKPGLYMLKRGERVLELLKLAGVGRKADLNSINLADKLEDGQKIVIEKMFEASKNAVLVDGGATVSNVQTSKVNLNTADEKELDSLPGIGPAMAAKILEYRKTKGRFQAIEDLKKVGGISDKKLSALKGKAVVR